MRRAHGSVAQLARASQCPLAHELLMNTSHAPLVDVADDADAEGVADAAVGGTKHVRERRSKSAKRCKSHLPERKNTTRTLLRTVRPGGTTLLLQQEQE